MKTQKKKYCNIVGCQYRNGVGISSGIHMFR